MQNDVRARQSLCDTSLTQLSLQSSLLAALIAALMGLKAYRALPSPGRNKPDAGSARLMPVNELNAAEHGAIP